MSLVGAPPSAIWVLTFAALVGFAGWRARLALAPRWSGAPASLATAVLAISIALILAEALGIAGILDGLALELAALAAAAAGWALTRGRGSDAGRGEGTGWTALGVAAALAAVTLAIWLLGALRVLDGGPMAFDSNWYHLPLAASFARSGSVTAIPPIDPITLARFYPADAELFHAVGMAIMHRDVLSPLVNLGWMLLALLAGWCIGRPFGTAPLSLLGVAVVLAAHVLSASQAGSATNDIVATAAFLAAGAILVTVFSSHRDRAGSLGPVAIAGLAAGLAAGTKLNLLVPVAVLGAGVAVVVAPGSRARSLAVWLAGAAATGGLWYLRNLVVAGNPLPWLHSLGPVHLPSPGQAEGLRPSFTVAHYLGDTGVWSNHLFPGLRVELGDLWPLLLAVALAAIVASIARPAAPAVRVLGLAALAGAVAYVLTPLSAGGPEGDPVVFATNLRWLAPFLAAGLALAPLPLAGRRAPSIGLAVTLAAIGVVNLDLSAWFDDSNLSVAVLIAGGVALAWLGVVALRRHGAPALAAVAVGGAALVLAAIVAPRADDYLHDRFRSAPARTGLEAAFGWARDVRGARIALAGTAVAVDQYPLYGEDVSNEVGYLGREGPHGSLEEITSCRAWRRAVDRSGADYLVTAPDFNASDPGAPRPAPQGAWTRPGAGSATVAREGPTDVFRITGPLGAGGC